MLELRDLVRQLLAVCCIVGIPLASALMLLHAELLVALLKQLALVPLLVHLALQRCYPLLSRPDLLVAVCPLRCLPAVSSGGRSDCTILSQLLLRSCQLLAQVAHLLLFELAGLLQVRQLPAQLAAVLLLSNLLLHFQRTRLVAVLPPRHGLSQRGDGRVVLAQHRLLLVYLSQQAIQLVLRMQRGAASSAVVRLGVKGSRDWEMYELRGAMCRALTLNCLTRMLLACLLIRCSSSIRSSDRRTFVSARYAHEAGIEWMSG